MKPYLYLNREREERKYGGLKIFIDNIDLLGTYVEIELQKSNDPVKELQEFIKKVGIKGGREKLYGDIFKEKLKSDEAFKEMFEEKLRNFILSK